MIRTYSPAEQEQLLRQHARQGSFRALALLGRRQHEIEDLMIERAMGVGLDEYGDQSFHLTLPQLDRESMEEAADLVMYETIYNLRERGLID